MLDQSVQRRLVGAALRRYRERLGYRIEDAALVLECNPSKISRIETGQRGIRPLELRILLNTYAIDEVEQQTVLAIANPRLVYGWWRGSLEVLPTATQDYRLLEAIAYRISCYDAQQIPDIMQTPAYAHALADISLSQEEADTRHRLADMQVARQQSIVQGQDHPEISVVIGEGAFHRAVGDAAVMSEQVQHLLEVSTACPWVVIRLLPLSSLAHVTVASGSLEILHFPGAPELGVVRYPVTTGLEICHVSEENVAAAVGAFTRIKAAALDPGASAEMLRALADG
jgi:transcriptional regulator with XRE-family HTH domain